MRDEVAVVVCGLEGLVATTIGVSMKETVHVANGSRRPKKVLPNQPDPA